MTLMTTTTLMLGCLGGSMGNTINIKLTILVQMMERILLALLVIPIQKNQKNALNIFLVEDLPKAFKLL